MDTNRLPKQALQYKPKGRRNIERPRKRWRDQLHLEDQRTGNTPNPSGTDDNDDDDSILSSGKTSASLADVFSSFKLAAFAPKIGE